VSWLIASRTDASRWVAYADDGTVTYDPRTGPDFEAFRGWPVALSPVGPHYEPTGDDDEIGLYLLAYDLIPAPEVLGDPPENIPTPPELPDIEGLVS
jgi:hypothetical protein